ncbi:hypothetical protein J6590_011172 [Homalodisca vitripennis]|nr:hypothetical protein J6590_011172 [Homalodisca vitripennis]
MNYHRHITLSAAGLDESFPLCLLGQSSVLCLPSNYHRHITLKLPIVSSRTELSTLSVHRVIITGTLHSVLRGWTRASHCVFSDRAQYFVGLPSNYHRHITLSAAGLDESFPLCLLGQSSVLCLFTE